MDPDNSFEQVLANLEGQVADLVDELTRVREENTLLKIKLSRQEEMIKDFQNKSKFTNIVKSIGPVGEDAEKLKLRIEENIQIIDKCIAQLGENRLDI